MKIEEFYAKHYKKLMLVSYAVLLTSLILVITKFAGTGELFNRDISLKGGISVSVYKEMNIDEVKSLLESKAEEFSVKEITDESGNKIGLLIEAADISENELKEILKEYKINFNNPEEYQASTTSSSFGENFYFGLLRALIFSFIFMSIVVFISFRTFIPSLAVISAALTDIIATLAVINILEIKLSAAGIIAFLLVIGYSIDTDILLTTRMLKRNEGTYLERMKESMKTGLTMTFAAIAALLVGYIVAIPQELKQIFLIIIIALVVDIISTYFGNAGILIHYCKKKNIA